ncbi:hypothetical protein [Bacillus cereus]|uniref:hypothetical protein n=1 Tax=Bacillus cereus TaxID=1396 RepID=UPI000BFC92A7|nr:hypothetical protein [Bacillus cereus]PGO95944.1 hypothetical protein COA03_17590 [Bacillus cereus]
MAKLYDELKNDELLLPPRPYSKTRLYKIWSGIKKRTADKENTNYGGRGISMDEEWRNSYAHFYSWSMRNGYNEKLTLDRINPNGNYEPSNCRWANAKQQARNLRETHRTVFNEKLYAVKDVADTFGEIKLIIDNEITVAKFDEPVNYGSLEGLLKALSPYGLTLNDLLWLYHTNKLADFLQENTYFALCIGQESYTAYKTHLKYSDKVNLEISMTFKTSTENMLKSNTINKGKIFEYSLDESMEFLGVNGYYFLKLNGIFSKLYTHSHIKLYEIKLIGDEHLRLIQKYINKNEMNNDKTFNELLLKVEEGLKDVFYTPLEN